MRAHIMVHRADGGLSTEYLGAIVREDSDGITLDEWETRDANGETLAERCWGAGEGTVTIGLGAGGTLSVFRF